VTVILSQNFIRKAIGRITPQLGWGFSEVYMRRGDACVDRPCQAAMLLK